MVPSNSNVFIPNDKKMRKKSCDFRIHIGILSLIMGVAFLYVDSSNFSILLTDLFDILINVYLRRVFIGRTVHQRGKVTDT